MISFLLILAPYIFIIRHLVLLAVYSNKLKIREKKQELYFAAAGLCGVTLYYLLENIALTYTNASNVEVIISMAPFLLLSLPTCSLMVKN